MEAVTRIHTAAGLVLVGALAALAVSGAVFWVLDRAPAAWTDLARRVLLGLLVAQAAIGLVLALRGAAPAEGIHWLYGVAVISALLLPSAIRVDAPRARSAVLAAGALVAALVTWRLWASG